MSQDNKPASSSPLPQQGAQQAKPADDKSKTGVNTNGDPRVVTPISVPGQSDGKGMPEKS